MKSSPWLLVARAGARMAMRSRTWYHVGVKPSIPLRGMSQQTSRGLHSAISVTKSPKIFLLLGGVPFLPLIGIDWRGDEHEIAEAIGSQLNKSSTFRLAEIKQHGPNADRPWIIRGTSVYDITEWVGAHPGGSIILRAAGGSIEPYWDILKIHNQQYVREILEQYKIGNVDDRDLVDGEVPHDTIEDPFKYDPTRDDRLRVLTSRPYNAEPPGEVLASTDKTPNNLFYVRNHMWVPQVEEDQYFLTMELVDGTEKQNTMQELRDRFPKATLTAVMQCAGNRRNHMHDKMPTNGLQWTVGGISNATWSGVRLRDVLKDVGFPLDNPPDNAKHAQSLGLEAYGGSIPIAKALEAQGDVLLAYEMNGEPLPADHGFPLRVVVLGNVAARSVKWLSRITISDEESTSQWQRRDYKCFGPNETGKEDWASARSIQEMPVTSAITSITNTSDAVTAHGYAYSGGGREIVRVDVSEDDGKTWRQAELLHGEQHGSKIWTWKRWRYDVSSDGAKAGTLVVKATDEAYNTQPEQHCHIYNARGNLATAWHRLKVKDGAVQEQQ